MADGDPNTQETGGQNQETGGQNTGGENQGNGGTEQTGGTTTEETTSTFPSFRKAYKYKGGFDKFIYDTLKSLVEEE